MGKANDKSVAMAIGLNLLLTGLGYIYLGRGFRGLFAFLLMASCSVSLLSDQPTMWVTWLVLNIIMVIDMVILTNAAK
jgi:hypothetical protein